jgi:hypothetical protein
MKKALLHPYQYWYPSHEANYGNKTAFNTKITLILRNINKKNIIFCALVTFVKLITYINKNKFLITCRC